MLRQKAWYNQRVKCINPIQVTEDDKLRYHRYFPWNHHRTQQNNKQEAAALGLDASKTVGYDRCRQDRTDNRKDGNNDRVFEISAQIVMCEDRVEIGPLEFLRNKCKG